jgi:hypothetical protein
MDIQKQRGSVEARRAHKPDLAGSKPAVALSFPSHGENILGIHLRPRLGRTFNFYRPEIGTDPLPSARPAYGIPIRRFTL